MKKQSIMFPKLLMALIGFLILGTYNSALADEAQQLRCEDLNDSSKISELARINLSRTISKSYADVGRLVDPCKLNGKIPWCPPGSDSAFLERVPEAKQDLIRETIARCMKELKAARVVK